MHYKIKLLLGDKVEGKWRLNDHELVDVDGNINLSGLKLSKLPIKFGIVTGHFWCNSNQLTTLEGAPLKVGGDFYCDSNKLTTLKKAPIKVGDGFYCDNNQLTTLKGAPNKVGGHFWCFHNKLTNLKGSPKYVGMDFCCHCNQLNTMEDIPDYIGGQFICDQDLRYIDELTAIRARLQEARKAIETE